MTIQTTIVCILSGWALAVQGTQQHAQQQSQHHVAGSRGSIITPWQTQPETATSSTTTARRDNNNIDSMFVGECDLVLVHSDEFQDMAGLDIHIRTTITALPSPSSFIEAVAIRMDHYVLEFEWNSLQNAVNIWMKGEIQLVDQDLPLTFGKARYQLALSDDDPQSEYKASYQLGLGNQEIEDNSHDDEHAKDELTMESYIMIRLDHDHHWSLDIQGSNTASHHYSDDSSSLGDAVGLLGDYYTGEWFDRQLKPLHTLQETALAWQVNLQDPQLFRRARAPQLPYEACRVPTMPSPANTSFLRGSSTNAQKS